MEGDEIQHEQKDSTCYMYVDNAAIRKIRLWYLSTFNQIYYVEQEQFEQDKNCELPPQHT